MKSIIKIFELTKLFGYKNIQIDFSDPYKILVGENGSGKTTILNCLYYTLSKRFDLLKDIRFDTIKIIFNNNTKLSFSKIEVNAFVDYDREYANTQFYHLISDRTEPKDFKELKSIVLSDLDINIKEEKATNYLNRLGFKLGAPSRYIYKNVEKYVEEVIRINFINKLEVLNLMSEYNLFYFPTCRRIESSSLSFRNIAKNMSQQLPFIEESRMLDILTDNLTQFGMEDVKNSISLLTHKISEMTKEGFSSIMGGMLSQLSGNIMIQPEIYSFDQGKIKIILDRLGEKIKENDKNAIIEYISSKELNNASLNYLIKELIDLYDKQKKYDSAIKKFQKVCNNYLDGKSFIYDESSIDLYVEACYNHERLDLECLSSGEKQIISLFAKIYLNIDKKFIVLLDEPELSLSIFWQEKLLHDIIISNNCIFLFTVTHSPFIYKNEMVKYAKSLADYIF